MFTLVLKPRTDDELPRITRDQLKNPPPAPKGVRLGKGGKIIGKLQPKEKA